VSGHPRPRRMPIWSIHLLMLVAAGLAATSFTVGKAITAGLDPAVLTLLRFLAATLLFLPWIRLRHGIARPVARDLLRYAAISCTLAGFFWLMFLALRYTSALNTSVLFTLVPGISGIYSAILLGERLGRYRLLALALALPGALWILFEGDLERLLCLQLNKGDLLFFLACLLIAFYTPLVKLLHREEPMELMTFWILVTGCGWLLLLGGGKLGGIDWPAIQPRVWLGIIYLAVFCTIITFFLSQFAVLYLGPTRVMAYSYLYPPLVLVLDWMLGHGLPSSRTLAGLLLLVPAMFVLQQGARCSR